MTEEDIKKQLENKNKEIYLNKLKLDVINNMEGLVLTIDNLFNKVTTDSLNRVLGIAESFHRKDYIEKDIKEFMTSYQELFMKLLDEKKSKIEESIAKSNANYQEVLDKETERIITSLDEYVKKNINNLINTIQSYYEDEFCKERINDYFKNSFNEFLKEKIKINLKDRDRILYNTFKESYLKYLELNKNTIGE